MMPLQDALRFIAAVREDSELARRIGELGLAVSVEALSELGGAAGFAFSGEELRQAYLIDWRMREARYSKPSDTRPM